MGYVQVVNGPNIIGPLKMGHVRSLTERGYAGDEIRKTVASVYTLRGTGTAYVVLLSAIEEKIIYSLEFL